MKILKEKGIILPVVSLAFDRATTPIVDKKKKRVHS